MTVYRCNGNCGGRPAINRYRSPWYINFRVLGLFHVGVGDGR